MFDRREAPPQYYAYWKDRESIHAWVCGKCAVAAKARCNFFEPVSTTISGRPEKLVWCSMLAFSREKLRIEKRYRQVSPSEIAR